MLFGDNFENLQINTGAVEINLVHAGDGHPLLLLHGYPQSHVMWHAVAPQLAEHFHVICPDLRGYGDSSKPAGTISGRGGIWVRCKAEHPQSAATMKLNKSER